MYGKLSSTAQDVNIETSSNVNQRFLYLMSHFSEATNKK